MHVFMTSLSLSLYIYIYIHIYTHTHIHHPTHAQKIKNCTKEKKKTIKELPQSVTLVKQCTIETKEHY